MPSYLITGASRGLGYAFLKHLAASPSNTVIGLARDKSAIEDRLARDGIKGVTILQADIVDAAALQAAAEETAGITGGGLDVLVNNAAYVSEVTAFSTLADDLEDRGKVEADFLKSFEINVLGVYRTVSAFLPLIQKGTLKKVVCISTGMADNDMVSRFSIAISAPYAVSKAALNMLVAKYDAAYAKEGILFMAISPGLVNTAEGKTYTQEELAGVKAMVEQFKEYAPDFQGAISPAESVEKVLQVVDKASIGHGDGGSFVSHLGNKQWL